VQYQTGLHDLPDLCSFIRAYGLCTISNGLAWFYQTCENHQTCGLLYVLIELQTLWNIDRPRKNLSGLWSFIRPCGLCIISNSLAGTTGLLRLIHYRPSLWILCQTSIGLGEYQKTCRLYKVWSSLYNIDQPYGNHGPCALYKVWHSLYIIGQVVWVIYGLVCFV